MEPPLLSLTLPPLQARMRVLTLVVICGRRFSWVKEKKGKKGLMDVRYTHKKKEKGVCSE